ncbi:hypothetical protein F5878DRAFT_633761 [Lentinula raphanica]|uniref:Uncharacterized protein n=1 Tax=Lentinula raphanica TaxID=153919 RepID=A0AA38NYH0_9AGAR|nr:hypothetical protein F5878DRAFT_633761 [Lentinula raphanica]
MLLSRLTSVTFFAAVGMITVVGLPIPDEYNLSPSAPTTNVRAPAVQLKIFKRGDDEPQNTRPLEPKWSPAGPPNPLLRASSSTLPQKRPPPADEDVSVGGNRERLPPEASAVGNRERVPSGSTEGNRGQSSTSNVQKTAGAFPPGAYPPVFGWAGGRNSSSERTTRKTSDLRRQSRSRSRRRSRRKSSRSLRFWKSIMTTRKGSLTSRKRTVETTIRNSTKSVRNSARTIFTMNESRDSKEK